MRIAVAGSTGFIGSALVPELASAGHEVRRLVRREPTEDNEFTWDPPAGTIDDNALAGVDAVVNLCGTSLIGRWSAAHKQAIRDSRIEPTEVLAEAVARVGVPALLNASGIGFYGDTGDVTVDEQAGQGAGFIAEVVGDWEAATKPATDAGARVVFMRNGLVLSTDGGLLRILKPIFWLGLGARLGEGRQFMPWISHPDAIAAIRFLIEHPEVSGPVNLCSPHPVTNREFTHAFASALGRPAPWFAPKTALRLALGDAADEMLLGGQHALPKKLTDAEFEFQHPHLDAALAAVT
ncbi:TIGR01777 family oxidoreductase [Haloechinothrix salitolerans]|uniref:TIGR01777 family oxidoreductase n=1 Tax=Haloechinothrix salitolerans TaxID=926830 RepID=A0ABW2C4E2_9PSEU